MVADASGSSVTVPAYDVRHANAAFEALSLESAQLAVATEKFGVGTTFLVRTIVACEHYDGVFVELFSL